MSLDLLLDLGSSKAFLAEIKGSRVENPVVFQRLDKDPEDWVRGILRSYSGSAATLAAASTGLVAGGRIYSGALGNLDLIALAEEELGIPALVVNDGHAAALAAARSGYQGPLLAAHVGTGAALGLWDDGIYEGGSGFSGEMLVDMGGGSLQRTYQELTGEQSRADKIARSAGQGNEAAARAVDDMCEALADELCRLVYFADPLSVVLSGGDLMQSIAPRLLQAISDRLRGREIWQQMLAERLVEVSPLGTWVPLYGAACLLAARPDFSDFI